MRANISVYHDTRFDKENETKKFPVKIQVYYQGERSYYKTSIKLTKDEFKRSYLAERPRGQDKKNQEDILRLELRAKDINDKLDVFSFDRFERRFLNPTGAGSDIFFQFETAIKDFEKKGKINTAINYQQALNSIRKFTESLGKSGSLSLNNVNKDFLDKYEQWMFTNGRQMATVGFYLRPLRALYNKAIKNGEVAKESYPFVKDTYTIPKSRSIKKTLSKTQLKALFEFSLDNVSPEAKARDFWFFSYVCNGMNIRDIAELKYKNIRDTTISFVRTKTRHTSKGDSKMIVVSIHPLALDVIEKHGNKKISPETYVFPILQRGMTERTKVETVRKFIRIINHHMQALAKKVGINEAISSYWARHTFTSVAIHNGASLEFIQDSLGHQNIATTMSYWKGFEENVKKEVSAKLMDF